MRLVRVIPHVAVPAPVRELRAEDRLGEGDEPRIVRVEEVRGQSQPEAEMAEIDALEQEGAVHVLVWRDEPVDECAERGLGGWVTFGHAERDEQQQRPGRGGPATGRPLAVRTPAVEQRRDPAFLDRAPPLLLPDRGRLVEQVAHHLPADRRVALEQPVDDRRVFDP